MPANGMGSGESGITGGTVRFPVMEPTDERGIINVGFHSFRKKPLAKNFCYGECMVRCVIPKGTYYRKNNREYVSDAIIIKEILTNQ
jgi:hypothetical protein